MAVPQTAGNRRNSATDGRSSKVRLLIGEQPLAGSHGVEARAYARASRLSARLLNVPYVEATRMYRRVRNGDAEAVAYFRSLWPEPGRCFLCDAALAPGAGSTTILPDPPRAPKGLVMLARQCDACADLPWMERQRRVVRLMRAMYPGWHAHGPAWGRW